MCSHLSSLSISNIVKDIFVFKSSIIRFQLSSLFHSKGKLLTICKLLFLWGRHFARAVFVYLMREGAPTKIPAQGPHIPKSGPECIH